MRIKISAWSSWPTIGIFHSEVLAGLWIKVDWLWQEPLPPLMSVLKEWGLV